MSASWPHWARELPDLRASERLVVIEISRLVDTRGVAMVTVSHLAEVTGRSQRTIRRSLQSLEGRGLVSRERRRDSAGRFLLSRVQLLRGRKVSIEKAMSSIRCGVPMRLDLSDPSLTREPVGSEKLRELLIQAGAENWEGRAADQILEILLVEGGRRFNKIVRNRRIFGDETDEWDTLSLAWEEAKTSKWLTTARDPWAVWVTSTSKAAVRADAVRAGAKALGVRQVDPSVMAQMGGTPIESEEALPPTIGVDDFGSIILGLVSALVAAGMSETIAYAGTARVIELMAVGKSKSLWLSARDARLQALGINEQAARAWMTAVTGSRRMQVRIFDSSADETLSQAHGIVAALNLFAGTA